MSTTFGDRLEEAVTAYGPLCVGIDPHPQLLHRWGLDDDVEGLRRFGDTVVEALAGQVAIAKPQSAFFERHGSAGVAVLEHVLAMLREVGVLSLLDVKRGDVGSTMAAYAEAYLSDGSSLAADAITVSPFLGFGSLAPAFELADATGRGVFVLAMTSNPEGAQVQHARVAADAAGEGGGVTVAEEIVSAVTERNAEGGGSGRFGSTGMVVGATVGKDIADLGLAQALADSRGPLLAPGLGAQGADAGDIARGFGPALPLVLPSSSRGILAAGPAPAGLRAAVRQQAAELAGG
ncbi:orotidine-5'-phosphate decarboxylase [Barrientosiimonas endolithica]|uniref:Orotidine 5'-phosphate decarboxylase n=1 Tax=Barrientosiimonas endolithica TaxID=1535208 RepID=A0ABN6YQN9_9MICO|nr:orotidine-5'-phosphate decarboxylase [Barrientosiimonas endolithica]BDZ58277.1 orotidine 5'-phosphate decarboxylase [Barrientosiimonas endolithica]